MIYDKDGDMNFNAWYSMNKKYFPPELREQMDENIDLLHFVASVYFKVMRELEPALHKLMREQYPVFENEKRKKVVEYIDDIAKTTGYALLFKQYYLIQDQKKGVNMREKYPKLDEWEEFYVKKHEPETISENERSDYPELTDEEWIKFRNKENAEIIKCFNWKEKRRFEFIDLVQTIIFKHFNELKELDHDEWTLYAVDIVDEYEYYLTLCEFVEGFIDHGFPEKDIDLPTKEYYKKQSQLSFEEHNRVSALRDRRINGEKI